MRKCVGALGRGEAAPYGRGARSRPAKVLKFLLALASYTGLMCPIGLHTAGYLSKARVICSRAAAMTCDRLCSANGMSLSAPRMATLFTTTVGSVSSTTLQQRPQLSADHARAKLTQASEAHPSSTSSSTVMSTFSSCSKTVIFSTCDPSCKPHHQGSATRPTHPRLLSCSVESAALSPSTPSTCGWESSHPIAEELSEDFDQSIEHRLVQQLVVVDLCPPKVSHAWRSNNEAGK